MKMPKTKIICTLGPASETFGILLKMMHAGMDVARLNFSHGSHEEHLARIRLVRQLNKKYLRHIRILGDLEGYRMRIGRLKGAKPVPVKKRQTLWLTQKKLLGSSSLISIDYRGPLNRIRKGQMIYIDDGTISLVVEGRQARGIRTRVVVPGIIKERKGINIPELRLDFVGVTAQDIRDIHFCVEHGVDFIAQSFVRTAADMLAVRRHLAPSAHPVRVIAKIENADGIRNIDEILRASDGIMVARGDMGISLPIYEVPLIQKAIIRKCNAAKKFVITATQMLESMTEHLLPTRAEVSDVANAILDGTDYVMLSAESAVGVDPANCVEMMNKIIKYTEENRFRE